MDFKLENVLASLHSLKNNGPRLHYFEGMELLGHSPIHNVQDCSCLYDNVVRLVICLLACEKHLHNHIISLKGELGP